MVDDMPGLRRSFFGGERRVFLTLREIWPMLAERDLIEVPDWSQQRGNEGTTEWRAKARQLLGPVKKELARAVS